MIKKVVSEVAEDDGEVDRTAATDESVFEQLLDDGSILSTSTLPSCGLNEKNPKMLNTVFPLFSPLLGAYLFSMFLQSRLIKKGAITNFYVL